MSNTKQPGRLKKAAVAAAIIFLVFAAGYCLFLLLPTGQTFAFIQAMDSYRGTYRPWLTVCRLAVLAALYGLAWWGINTLLKRGNVNPMQKRFLLGLRWQALAFLLLMEWLLGPHGPAQRGN